MSAQCKLVGVFAALLLFVAGCGGGAERPEIAPVSGRVTYQGQSVEGAKVTFRTEGSPRVGTGITNADGEYKLTTFDTNDGAVVGEHRVTIAKFEQEAASAESEGYDPENPGAAYGQQMMSAASGKDKRESQLPAKYADPATTPLTRTVVAGEENVFNFELED